jgi:(p)ppGpp synthase/HD superfamily hydrolase
MKEKAKAFAAIAHQGQYRKNSAEPYIVHPVRVAERLDLEGFPEELICAAYLHDVVEDTPYGPEDIADLFGCEVARIVAAHTEDKSKSWIERKQHTIDTVKTADKAVKYLIVADKLDNLLDMEQALKKQGDAVWDHFHAGFEKQRWYNKGIAANMYDGLETKDIPAFFKEYAEAVTRVFG